MEPVQSRQNRKVVEAARLLRVRDGFKTLLQGRRLVDEAVASGVDIERVFVLEDDRVEAGNTVEVVPVTKPVMERLAPTGDSWGPVAVASLPPRRPRPDRPVVVAVDIADPGNLGTMVRSAAAFGFDVAVVGGADPFSPKVLRAGAGGHFRVHVDRPTAPPERPLVAAVVSDGVPPASLDLAPDFGLLIGSEADGLPSNLIAQSAARVTIPMDATESLNAGVAAAILMYELRPKAGRIEGSQD